MGNYHYDSHCHIFTLRYLLKEVKSMLRDVLLGTYPWDDPKTKSSFVAKRNWKDLKGFLRSLYELIHASMGTEEKNLDFLQDEARKIFPSSNQRIVPLMMDIFYMLAYPLHKDKDIETFKSSGDLAINKKEFQKCWDIILDDLKVEIQSPNSPLKAISHYLLAENIDQNLKIIEDERSVEPSIQLKNNISSNTELGFYKTGGFSFHMSNLKKLEKKRKGELYPFIAIDPRRPGILDELLTGSFFTGEGRFYGVKLYPRMGYHPLSKPMDTIYKYCNDNNIPIIFHCGKSGFPNSKNWEYSDFSNPIHFEPVVKKYRKLKINFAHLGSADPSLEWAETIIRLVNENENVYSDLSCYTNMDELKIIFPFWENNPKLKSRLMFGTDFDLMYFTDVITMETYYSNFQEIFRDEFKYLIHDNPTRFLGLND